MHVVHFGQLADRFTHASDAIPTAPLDVELLDDLVEGAQDLHVSELSITVQIFIL